MRSLLMSLATGAALLAVPPAANAQMRALSMGPRVTFNGATHTLPFPSRVFVPPTINSTTVQSNWNHWANGGYPNIAAAANYRLALANRNAVYGSLYNPYTMYAYNPYAMYAYGGYGGSGGYGGYGGSGGYGGYGGYGSGGYGSYGDYGSYQSPSMTSANTDPYSPTGTVQSGRVIDVGIYDNRFEPKSITVTAGATVRWTNYDIRPREVTDDGGALDSGNLAPGSSHSYTFSKPGTYKYHCSDHPRMTGTVIVQ